ncbi:MAG: hypothetical protein WCD69_22685 [Xanthobacteraceae bacterium]
MHLLAGAAMTALVTLISLGADAADLNPPAPFGQPQYGMAPPPPVAPPQVIIVPGPGALQYPSAAFPSPVAPPPPSGVPPIYPRADVPPRVVCPPTWRCGEYGCGWQPNCAPPARYSDQYAPPGPIYAQPGPAGPPGPIYAQPGPVGPPGPPVYSEPTPPPAPYSDPYAPRSYPGPTGPY